MYRGMKRAVKKNRVDDTEILWDTRSRNFGHEGERRCLNHLRSPYPVQEDKMLIINSIRRLDSGVDYEIELSGTLDSPSDNPPSTPGNVSLEDLLHDMDYGSTQVKMTVVVSCRYFENLAIGDKFALHLTRQVKP